MPTLRRVNFLNLTLRTNSFFINRREQSDQELSGRGLINQCFNVTNRFDVRLKRVKKIIIRFVEFCLQHEGKE